MTAAPDRPDTAAEVEQASADLPWRVGQHYGIHIYGGPDGQTPIGTTHLANDAALIVAAVNALAARRPATEAEQAVERVRALCDERDRVRGFTMLGTDEVRAALDGDR